MRAIFSLLLRRPAPTPAQVARTVSRVLRRKEESRIYHWLQATGKLPPRRPRPASRARGKPTRAKSHSRIKSSLQRKGGGEYAGRQPVKRDDGTHWETYGKWHLDTPND